ncbi:MAG: hypothetical protein LQ340_000102 [Diploschistes diacapsis]|nr:MAG: hypothetical protein LQ340_000102 [Diploschistes diacapsis]
MPIIEGEIRDARCVSRGIPFTNLAPLTDENLVRGNPDVYYGARPEQLDRGVRNEQIENNLSDRIVPSTQHDLAILPNFVLAVKGPEGSLAVAGRSACYDGALRARAMHALHSYGQQDPFYDGNAYTVSSIYHGGQLKMFTSHPIHPATLGDLPEYITSQINTWGMTGNAEIFRQGATAYRNLRYWAREQRDTAIKQTNDQVRTSVKASTSETSNVSLDSSFATQASEEETSTNDTQQEALHRFIRRTSVLRTPHKQPSIQKMTLNRILQSLEHPITTPRRATSERKRRNKAPEEAGGFRISPSRLFHRLLPKTH